MNRKCSWEWERETGVHIPTSCRQSRILNKFPRARALSHQESYQQEWDSGQGFSHLCLLKRTILVQASAKGPGSECKWKGLGTDCVWGIGVRLSSSPFYFLLRLGALWPLGLPSYALLYMRVRNKASIYRSQAPVAGIVLYLAWPIVIISLYFVNFPSSTWNPIMIMS